MADNFTAGAYTFGADEISAALYERVKIILGGDGTNSGDMASGAGAVGATVPRVTLASDDPAVVDLAAIEVLLTGIDADTDAIKTAVQLIDNAISGAGFNITQLGGAAVPIGAGTEAAAVRVTIATDSTGTLSIDDGGGVITVDGNVVVTNAGTFAVQAACVLGAETTKVIGTVNLAAAQTLATLTSITNAVVINGGAGQTTDIKVTLDSEAVVLGAGSAAIGKLAANSGVDIGDVDVLSIAAGTNTIGGVIAQQSTSVAYDGTTACTIKRFMVAGPADGNSLIAAVASKKFRILSFAIWSISGTICRFWLDDADAAVVFGNSTGFPLEEDSGAAPPGFILPHNPGGWFQTATANKALRIQFASGSGVVVIGTYIEVA